jgi:hypothetical protein
VPSTGQVMEKGAPPRQGVPTGTASAPQAGTPQNEGVIKGHSENIVAQLAIAKLLPGIEAADGGIDWQVFRTYRDLYYHNVSNVPVEPLVLHESDDEQKEDGDAGV